MCLTEFTRDIVPIIQAVLTLLGLGSLLLVWWQIRENRLWNRMVASFQLYDEGEATKREKSVIDECKKIGVDIIQKCDEEDLKKIKESTDAMLAINHFLNEQEKLCAARNIGYADDKVLYGIHSDRVIRTFRRFRPYIIYFRAKNDDDEIFIEIEKCAIAWASRLQEEKLQKISQTEIKEAKRLQEGGIKKVL